MVEIDESTISRVLDVYLPERSRLIEFLRDLDEDDWDRPTECPAYSVKGIASHILGDDLSLISRQRDGATQGLILIAEKMPGADFRGLLDGFNDQWVEACRFMSTSVLLDLLDVTGRWTHDYYAAVDPLEPGEPVLMFGASFDDSSPFWQAIAREYIERWCHHSQIRRALGRGSLADAPFLETGHAIVATVAGTASHDVPKEGDHDGAPWTLGPVVLGDRAQTADLLTLAHRPEEVAALVDGPDDLVAQLAERVGRR